MIDIVCNDKKHWVQIINEARSNRQLCDAIAEFMNNNCIVLTGERDPVTGVTTYGVKFNRPHMAEVERAEGRKHWVVNERPASNGA